MEFNHLTFYVTDVAYWRHRFVEAWQGQVVGPRSAGDAVVCLGRVPIRLVQPQRDGDAATLYLGQHPPGVGDVAFRVANLEACLEQVRIVGGRILCPIQDDPEGRGRWSVIQGWGNLRHTLVESTTLATWIPEMPPLPELDVVGGIGLDGIDHVVLNVPDGQLSQALDWYGCHLGFQPQQQFTIDTAWSGLRSQVLTHPEGAAQLPINEPATANSQVQEFLDHNGGTGIQHVALHTSDIVATVAQLRGAGVSFLDVPEDYYRTLQQRSGFVDQAEQMGAIARLKILMDWEPDRPQAQLLQTFTQPLLDIPTFFFEIIQRQSRSAAGQIQRAKGFGERNFQALFEAIEMEQRRRGTLAP